MSLSNPTAALVSPSFPTEWEQLEDEAKSTILERIRSASPLDVYAYAELYELPIRLRGRPHFSWPRARKAERALSRRRHGRFSGPSPP